MTCRNDIVERESWTVEGWQHGKKNKKRTKERKKERKKEHTERKKERQIERKKERKTERTLSNFQLDMLCGISAFQFPTCWTTQLVSDCRNVDL